MLMMLMLRYEADDYGTLVENRDLRIPLYKDHPNVLLTNIMYVIVWFHELLQIYSWRRFSWGNNSSFFSLANIWLCSKRQNILFVFLETDMCELNVRELKYLFNFLFRFSLFWLLFNIFSFFTQNYQRLTIIMV